MASEDLERGGRNGKNRANSYHQSSSPFYVENTEKQWTSWLVPIYVAKFLGKLSFQPSKKNPLFGHSSHTLDKLGALNWDKVAHGKQGWRLITCIWLHAGCLINDHLIHYLLNEEFDHLAVIAYICVFPLTVHIGLIYLLSGFGGSILSSLFIQDNIFVGASGALFGLLGAMLLELLTNWTIYTNKFVDVCVYAAVLITLVVIIAINLVVGILPHVDNFAHIDGFLIGFLFRFVLLLRPQFGWVQRQHVPVGAPVKSKHKSYQYVFWVIAVVLDIVGFTVGLVMLFRGENGNDHCSWCHYLSCVPTSSWHCGK
ncbi:hypothetical protein Golob_013725 [Gossypium lobatum]|uniref:RHOMBOID-like protein n=1 Tax=Gossypium lobatum TaxID=34289 RepID=A0A7J8LQ99_9ROSI|nr:hypothetical protein [Gossypium lobatum]